MDKSDIITLLIALIAIVPAFASLKASSRAAAGEKESAIITSRSDAETEAYLRARTLDTETINRQGSELKEMRAELTALHDKYEELETKYDRLESQHKNVVRDNQRLRERIVELEHHHGGADS